MEVTNESKPQYRLTQSCITVDNRTVTTYGIAGNSVEFPDASTEKATVLAMVEKLNREQLEESQFMYFIEDELDR